MWLRDRRLALTAHVGRLVEGRGRRCARRMSVASADAGSGHRRRGDERLPAVRGPWCGWSSLVSWCHRGCVVPIELAPSRRGAAAVCAAAARACGRWAICVLWDELEWEGESGGGGAQALEERARPRRRVKGASAALRAAFALATAQAGVARAGDSGGAGRAAPLGARDRRAGRPAAETRVAGAGGGARACWRAARRRSGAAPQPDRRRHPKLEDRVRGVAARLGRAHVGRAAVWATGRSRCAGSSTARGSSASSRRRPAASSTPGVCLAGSG